MKQRLLLTFSGGRSSATMVDLIIDKIGDLADILICFANTGWEHEDTLRFVKACAERWRPKGHEVVWLECVINDTGLGTGHRVVNYFSASRNQEPFLDMVDKYGLPNKGYPHCTRELKEYPIRSYAREFGWLDASYWTCIGIRGDEPNRLNWGYCAGNHQIKIYPLANWFPMTKADVLNYWKDWEHDLRIEEAEGNCLGCFRKSDNKLARVNELHPQALEFAVRIEAEFGHVGKNKQGGVYVDEPRQLYRGNRSAGEIIATFKERSQCQKAS